MAGSSAAAASAGWHRADDGSPDRGLMSIGEVLAHLRADFPDVTISKLRFLETEGLVEPRRTPAGYRKYAWVDVTRLRYVLTAQRDHYLPLRVIREHLASLDSSSLPMPVTSSTAEPTELRLSREELMSRAGLDDALLRALEQHGLISVRNGGGYDADALEVASAAARLNEYG